MDGLLKRKEIIWMNKEFQTLRKKQRFSLRKLNIGVASVLLGFTIFGYNLASQAPVAHAATSAATTPSAGSSATGVASGSPASNSRIASATSSAATASQATPATQVPANQTESVTKTTPSAGSPATGVVSGSQASNSQAASATSAAATASQATSSTQVTVPAASQSSESANSGNATSSTANQAGTVSANQTSNTSAAGAPASNNQTVTVDETTLPATQAAILSTNLARLTDFKVGTRQRHSAMLLTNLAMLPNSETATPLPTTTQTYEKVVQPLLYDYMLHTATGTRYGKTWVDKTVADYPGNTLDTIFGTTSNPGIIPSNTDDKYFFAAYVDYSERYHRVILLARSQKPSDKNLYSYTIHTYWQKHSTTTTKPGESTKEQYNGIAGIGNSTYDLIFHNYGDSFTVKLSGFTGGWGLLPVFDSGLLDPTYGSNTLKQNDDAAKAKSIGFWASAIPQETSTKVRYVDQATGKDIVQPMEISGFGYQGFKVKGEAPTVPGYQLVSKPKFLGLPYEDGTIAPYKVGQTYDLALSDSVVIKQTVIHTDGTVRATPYYKGSPLTNASKVLGRESYNDHMSFGTPDGKYYTYNNRIGQVDGSYIYYYAKDSDSNGTDMRLHFIDVTGVNNSSYAPSDGPELDVDNVQTIHGNIGDNYSFTYTVPKGYDQVGTSDVTGTYSVTRHDAYVYVKKYTVAAGKPVTLTHGQKVKAGDSLDSSAVTLKDAKGQAVSLPDGAKVVWATAPATSEVGNDKTGQAKVVYGDQSESEPVTVTYNVTQNDADQYTPTVKDKTKVDDPKKLTAGEKKAVEDNIRDNNPGLPEGTKIDVGDNGDTTITYPDKSVVTILGNKLVEEKTSAENLDPTVPAKTKVDDPKKLTNDEKKEVEDKVTEANKDKFPEGTEVTVDDDGTVTINYPDGSQDTIPGDQVVEAKTDADKTNPTVLRTKVEVKDPNNLTDEEKQQVKESIENANKYQFPEGTQVTIGNDGTATITYPDGSQDVIPGSQLVTKQGSDVANTGDVKNNGQGTTASIQGVTADTTAKKLPQTGEQDTSATAATGLGLIILSLLGLFGLGSKKRKED